VTGRRAIGGLVAVAAVVVLIGWWSSWLTVAPARADGFQNLAAGWNLARTGTFSTRPDGRPDMFREPLVPVLTAAAIRLAEAGSPSASLADWSGGERVRALKHQNLIWMLLLCGGVWGAVRGLGASRVSAGAAVMLANGVAFGLRREFVDSLGSDLAGAALLVTASALLARGWISTHWRWWIAAGLVLGLAILVKASLLYVSIGLAAALTLLAAWRAKGLPGDNRGVAILLMLLTAAAVTTPWSERNFHQFGTRALTDRGGEVLLIRAYEDQVTPTEYAGVWCAYAPGRLRPWICRAGGWSRADMAPGGRLGRFNRAPADDPDAIRRAAEPGTGPAPGLSFYQTAKARNQLLAERYAARKSPRTAVDAAARQEAVALIRARPDLHLAMTPAFLWRGMGGLTVWLALAALAALVWRRDAVAVFLLPSVGLGLFLALFSHFIPRYAWLMLPAVCVVLPVFLEATWLRLVSRVRASAPRPGLTGR